MIAGDAKVLHFEADDLPHNDLIYTYQFLI